jgi:hypothetical protein
VSVGCAIAFSITFAGKPTPHIVFWSGSLSTITVSALRSEITPASRPRLDRLGQKPFDTFLANPIAPPRQRRGIDERTVLE